MILIINPCCIAPPVQFEKCMCNSKNSSPLRTSWSSCLLTLTCPISPISQLTTTSQCYYWFNMKKSTAWPRSFFICLALAFVIAVNLQLKWSLSSHLHSDTVQNNGSMIENADAVLTSSRSSTSKQYQATTLLRNTSTLTTLLLEHTSISTFTKLILPSLQDWELSSLRAIELSGVTTELAQQ